MLDRDEHELTKKILYGARLGVALALQDHKQKGDPILVTKDGTAQWIPANEIKVVFPEKNFDDSK